MASEPGVFPGRGGWKVAGVFATCTMVYGLVRLMAAVGSQTSRALDGAIISVLSLLLAITLYALEARTKPSRWSS